MAVTIWTTNRMPTAVAILRAGIGSMVRDVGALVALKVVMACLSDRTRDADWYLTLLD